MTDELTPAEEKFVEYVVIYKKTYAEAYRLAYPNTKMSDNAIYSKASNMINGTGKFAPPKDKVRIRFLELKQKALEENQKMDPSKILTIANVLTTIVEIMQDKNAKNRDRLRAAELAGKYLGLFNEHVQIETDLPLVIKDDVKE